MIPNQVLEQLAAASFDKAQVIIVMKMLLVTAENARAQMREETRQELAEMRSSFGRLIVEAVEATEAKIFARLEKEKAKDEEKKRERREQAAVRKREREKEAMARAEAERVQKLHQLHQDALFADGFEGGLNDEPVLDEMNWF